MSNKTARTPKTPSASSASESPAASSLQHNYDLTHRTPGPPGATTRRSPCRTRTHASTSSAMNPQRHSGSILVQPKITSSSAGTAAARGVSRPRAERSTADVHVYAGPRRKPTGCTSRAERGCGSQVGRVHTAVVGARVENDDLREAAEIARRKDAVVYTGSERSLAGARAAFLGARAPRFIDEAVCARSCEPDCCWVIGPIGLLGFVLIRLRLVHRFRAFGADAVS